MSRQPFVPPLDKLEWRSLRSGFLKSAAAAPVSPALIIDDTTRSYGELERTARVWAHAIVTTLGRPAERVGVFAYRSEAAYAGVLAALMSGATFVPLNRTFPVERTRAMARAAALDVIVVDESSFGQLEDILAGLAPPPIVLFPADAPPRVPAGVPAFLSGKALSEFPPLEVLPPVIADDIAYLLFTSGSTGEPKGVPVTHGNVLHFIDVMVQRYGVGPGDRLSQTFDLTFDLSVFDLFVAWERGACVCVLQPIDLLAPARFVAKHGVTMWFSVPSVAALMRKKNLLRPNILPTLRWSLFCGEPLPRASAEAWSAAAPNAVLDNLYGPTELTIACFAYRWDVQRSPAQCHNELVPIGRPLPGLCAFVAADGGAPPSDEPSGELYVAGPQTVPGYWRDPVRTGERFVDLPITETTSKRFYRTGDRVSRRDDGDYVYLGRTDHQIKVLGFRVELPEIEAVLCRDPRVVSAVAVGWPVEEGRALGVVAFVTGMEIDTHALKRQAEASLTAYMVPTEIHVLESFPLNPNGKVDRGALLARLAGVGRERP